VNRTRRIRPALSLRYRVMAAFGLVSVAVSGAVAVLTWNLSNSYMTKQREQSAIRQAVVNDQLIASQLRHGADGLADLLAGLGAQVESAVLLVDADQWISSGTVDPQRLPQSFLDTVTGGQPASQRVFLAGSPVLAVGLPVRGADATYVEVFPLRELDKTMRFLSVMLLVGVLGSGVAGALLGRWAAARALRPLTRLTRAAAAAAAGDLDYRMPDSRDPDLAPIVAAFNETAAQLQDRVARDARFAADVSHELRSPLTTMVNAIAVLERRKAAFGEPAQQAVELLAADLRRFKTMVEDLLEISVSDQRVVAEELEEFDLAELVARAAEHTAETCPAVETDVPAPRVKADRRRLERVVANLVTNAERHGGGLVRLAVHRRDNRLLIEVDDAGPGVPEQDRDRIFGRFARGRPDRFAESTPGVGLGLALAAEHVRRHRGRISVADRPGGGARFIVELPCEPAYE
jgi:signal transduction histidine kinase